MKTRIFRLGLIIAVLLVALAISSVAFAGRPVHKVEGGGTTIFPQAPQNVDGREIYGFTAQVDAAGNVTGQGQFTFVQPVGTFHATMTCLEVDGNKAWLGMVITSTDNPTQLPVGLDFTWEVQDNGQGANASPDLQSFFYPGLSCHDKQDLLASAAFTWTTGNIQVDPGR